MAGSGDDSVIQRVRIVGQSGDVPGSNFDGIDKAVDQFKVGTARDVTLFDQLQPPADGFLPELSIRHAQVSDVPGRQQNVTGQTLQSESKFVSCVLPRLLFSA